MEPLHILEVMSSLHLLGLELSLRPCVKSPVQAQKYLVRNASASDVQTGYCQGHGKAGGAAFKRQAAFPDALPVRMIVLYVLPSTPQSTQAATHEDDVDYLQVILPA
ncbi:unnamed protein product [Symbiodinium natans]|uniref:Uncharacterized protein n=1 Tax=Symbiodinium natans TaxID=878477 RepID=A0A812PKH7_9DINO|nr:unnamed protein product [Symbiodinium natans]